ncbi:Asp-tRNA(Asn)/Glu-tRNA(Gln) amidotransferase subunit GatB [Candidatus Wolfebacteria bacterium]|nr:Asp-tRNA(Asn)/Glu-tRNA(Gln) amidotransferase subunit GatB [Candidatus Wolfebacteria bacterium]
MKEYKPTIGLEVHSELKTKTKMFCGCSNNSDEKNPNVNVCPICLGHPGTLPVINKQAVEMVLRFGLALGARIPEKSKFDRKNYFYPDLPKAYQISQYDKPLVIGGKLNNVEITRVHLEEDTGRLIHSADGKSSFVDFNRAGVPLMELVTEPDIKSGKEAMEFAKELQLILRHLEISDANMEKGQMRVEVNISISRNNKKGTKVELKNLNSFRVVGEAIDYEIKRQTEVLEKGDLVIQETRGWNEIKKKTFSQRIKEEAHDYRYFPEPDLPSIDLSSSAGVFNIENLKISIPELPIDKRKRFLKEYNLNSEQAEILIEDRSLANYFEESTSELLEEFGNKEEYIKNIGLLFNYLSSDLKGLLNEQKITIKELKITPENFADLIVLIGKGEISSKIAKDILKEMFLTGLDPRQIIEQKGLSRISDEEVIRTVVREVINKNPKAIEDYKKGKQNVIQFLIGQVMAKTKGRADTEMILKLLDKENKVIDKNDKK